jgi:hypothetical protein
MLPNRWPKNASGDGAESNAGRYWERAEKCGCFGALHELPGSPLNYDGRASVVTRWCRWVMQPIGDTRQIVGPAPQDAVEATQHRANANQCSR